MPCIHWYVSIAQAPPVNVLFFQTQQKISDWRHKLSETADPIMYMYMQNPDAGFDTPDEKIAEATRLLDDDKPFIWQSFEVRILQFSSFPIP